MKTLALAVALGLLAALQAQDPLTLFQGEEDITGTWYTKAMVADKALPEGKRPRKVFPMTVTALGDGSLEATITFQKKGQCHKKTFVLQKTERPGEYTALGGTKRVWVERLPASGHHTFYCEHQQQGRTLRMAKLMGRNPDPSPEALEEFKEFAQRKGFLQEHMLTPEQEERCVPASS